MDYPFQPKQISAMYIFGDDLQVDNGNNNYLPMNSSAKFFPYGIDFIGGTPTGRFTNGRTMADYIGKKTHTICLLFFSTFNFSVP